MSCSPSDSYDMSVEQTVNNFMIKAYVENNEEDALLFLSPSLSDKLRGTLKGDYSTFEVIPLTTTINHEDGNATHTYRIVGTTATGKEKSTHRTSKLIFDAQRWIIDEI